jgi:hypothetical protein
LPAFSITIETSRIEHRDRIKNLILDLVKAENKKPIYTQVGTFTITQKETHD